MGTLTLPSRKSRSVLLFAGDKEFMIMSSPYGKLVSDIQVYNLDQLIKACAQAQNNTVESNEKFMKQKIDLGALYAVAVTGPASKYIYVGSDVGKGKPNNVKIIERSTGKTLV